MLMHSGGASTFAREEVLAYGSLDNLIASDLLAGIPNREVSLGQLWEAANMPLVDLEAPSAGRGGRR